MGIHYCSTCRDNYLLPSQPVKTYTNCTFCGLPTWCEYVFSEGLSVNSLLLMPWTKERYQKFYEQTHEAASNLITRVEKLLDQMKAAKLRIEELEANGH